LGSARPKPNSAFSFANDAPIISRMSLARAWALSNSPRSRVHSPMKAFFAPRFKSDAVISACICATSSRRRSLDSPISASFSMRLCTTRSACSLVVHSSNSAVSSSTRLSISRTLALLLPRMPRNSIICSASWRRESPRRRDTWASTSFTASSTTCCITWRRCQQLRRQRFFQRGEAARGQPFFVADQARGQGLARRQREDPLRRHLQRACRFLALRLDLRGDLAGGGQRIDQRVDLVEHDEARQVVRVEVIAPDRHVGLRDTGV